MSVEHAVVKTARGDVVSVALFMHADEEPTILVSVVDADDTVIPTAEFTLAEAGVFRDVLRGMGERGAGAGVRRG